MNLDDIGREMTVCMRLMTDTGLCHMRGGNCAMRTGPDELVVTRTKTAKEELTAEHLMRLPIHSNEPAPGASVNLSLHRSIFRKTGANVVLHGHPYHATLRSYFTDAIAPIDENGLSYLAPRIRVIAPPGLRQWAAIDEAMSDALTEAPVAVLRWHGSFAIGDGFAEAFHRTQALDTAARLIIDVARHRATLGTPTYPAYVAAPPAAIE